MMATRCSGRSSKSRHRAGTRVSSSSTLSKMYLANMRSRLESSVTYHGFLSTALCWASADSMIFAMGISLRASSAPSASSSPTWSRSRRRMRLIGMCLLTGCAKSSSDSSPGSGSSGCLLLIRKVLISSLMRTAWSLFFFHISASLLKSGMPSGQGRVGSSGWALGRGLGASCLTPSRRSGPDPAEEGSYADRYTVTSIATAILCGVSHFQHSGK
jgi:hypothetical protein